MEKVKAGTIKKHRELIEAGGPYPEEWRQRNEQASRMKKERAKGKARKGRR